MTQRPVRLSEEGREAWDRVCAEHGVSFAAMVDVLGVWLADEAAERTVRRLVQAAREESARRAARPRGR